MNLKKRFTLSLKNNLRFLPDRFYVSLYYFAKFGGRPNIDRPVTFNEKIQWVKLNYRNPELPRLVDKFEVRHFVEERIGSEYLVPCYGVFENEKDYLDASLPDTYVVKCTHDSQSTHVCDDKSSFDVERTAKELAVALKRNWYWQGREWAYKDCKPRIIAEAYLQEPGKHTPNDYKFYCFDGKVKMVQADTDRFASNHKQQYFSPDWESLGDWDNYKVPDEDLISKPEQLERMIALSEILSAGFPHVRVDWYSIEGKLYFGELTFYTGGGFDPFHAQENKLSDTLDKYLGDCFVLDGEDRR